MSKRFLTYNTEDAGKVPVNSQGIIDPKKIPCYDSRDIRTVTYTFDGNLEGKEYVTFYEEGDYIDGCVKVADDIPEVSTIQKFNAVVAIHSDGTTNEAEFPADRIFEEDGVVFFQNDSVMYMLKETEYDGKMFPKGLYFRHQTDSYSIVKFSCDYVASGELKKLDDKFVPPSFFLVTFTEAGTVDGKTVLSSSATISEIRDAYLAGRFPIARFENGFFYPRELLLDEVYVDFYDIDGSGAIEPDYDGGWFYHSLS